MGHMFKISKLSAWLVLCAALTIQSAYAQKRYPSPEEAWDATDYRALVERIERAGLELPTLSGEATKPVFERMVAADNIPLRMGQNPDLAITLRYQKLKPILQPLDQLVAFYSDGAKQGKPYSTELARLMVYETQAAGALLALGDPYLATLKQDPRYQTHVALLEQMKGNARDIYSRLITSMSDTNLYSKSDILFMVKGAFNELRKHDPIFTDADRKNLTQTLSQQISNSGDQEVKAALTELRDAIKNSQVPT